jgi:hypothetical protein
VPFIAPAVPFIAIDETFGLLSTASPPQAQARRLPVNNRNKRTGHGPAELTMRVDDCAIDQRMAPESSISVFSGKRTRMRQFALRNAQNQATLRGAIGWRGGDRRCEAGAHIDGT